MSIKVIKILFIILIFVFIFIGYLKFFEKKEVIKSEKKDNTDISYNTNIIMDVNYSSIDSKGNEYNIYAEKGEIDFDNSNIVYLTNLKALEDKSFILAAFPMKIVGADGSPVRAVAILGEHNES